MGTGGGRSCWYKRGSGERLVLISSGTNASMGPPQRGAAGSGAGRCCWAGGALGAARGRRFCRRPVNATIAAEKDDCPVCVTVATAICSGYCQTKEPVYKSALAPVSQHVCSYRAVRYETLALPGCPPGVDPAFTFPVALSCHCSLCPMDSSDCTVHSLGPDFCSAPGGDSPRGGGQ
ncbi:LOW QUALITY PROTEIN: lutropin subunit beta-like [Chrysemys picta bellii]|uniref:LOW QUALITY PROTEIN: lutropin subunit beta-like n=1 Tax=Chrysemys picta bellii TaxID=8478 RepID=UPI0032B21F12